VSRIINYSCTLLFLRTALLDLIFRDPETLKKIWDISYHKKIELQELLSENQDSKNDSTFFLHF